MKKDIDCFNMNKDELENLFKEYNDKSKNVIKLFISTIIFAFVVLFSSCAVLFFSKIIALSILILSIPVILASGVINFVKCKDIEKNMPKIKNRLENILEMEYEKKRNEIEKNKDVLKDKIINEMTINDRRLALLREFKKNLENYNIYYLNNELNNEIDNLEYTKKLLNEKNNG